jgi:hypothetical protein
MYSKEFHAAEEPSRKIILQLRISFFLSLGSPFRSVLDASAYLLVASKGLYWTLQPICWWYQMGCTGRFSLPIAASRGVSPASKGVLLDTSTYLSSH